MAITTQIWNKLRNQSLSNRVLIGNSIVIIAGAVGGTLLTRYLTIVGNLGLILLFASLGLLLTLLVNRAIIRSALKPLRDVRQVVEQVEAGRPGLPKDLLQDGDPDIKRLITAVDAMLGRLERRTRQLRALSERTINAQEEERQRIARNLHDETAQSLSMLIINLERLENTPLANQLELQERLQETRLLATGALEELRRVIFDLRPAMLDDLGLVPAIRWYARSHLEAADIEIAFEVPEKSVRLPHYLETTLFRIAQEAVNNILRHADAGIVTVRLWLVEEQVHLEIEDDGGGFDVGRTVSQALHQKQLGLLGIQERAALVGGRADIDSTPGLGTRVCVTVPMRRDKKRTEKTAGLMGTKVM